MKQYSTSSLSHLETADPALQEVFAHALQIVDHSILEGFRGQERQDELHASGRTKKLYPESKHNSIPSNAVDAVPYPIDWSDTKRMAYFAGVVIGIGKMKGVDIRWGGDWDRDGQLKDNSFNDLVHFELVEKQ